MKQLIILTVVGCVLLCAKVISAQSPVAGLLAKLQEGDDCETVDISLSDLASEMGKRAPEEATTVAPSLPNRIRDAIYNSIRNLGNAVRFVPATVTEVLKNISRTTSEALRRNITVTLISEAPPLTPEPTTSTAAPKPKAKA